MKNYFWTCKCIVPIFVISMNIRKNMGFRKETGKKTSCQDMAGVILLFVIKYGSASILDT